MFHTVSSHVSRCKPGNRGMLPDPGVYSTRLVHPGREKKTIKSFIKASKTRFLETHRMKSKLSNKVLNVKS